MSVRIRSSLDQEFSPRAIVSRNVFDQAILNGSKSKGYGVCFRNASENCKNFFLCACIEAIAEADY